MGEECWCTFDQEIYVHDLLKKNGLEFEVDYTVFHSKDKMVNFIFENPLAQKLKDELKKFLS